MTALHTRALEAHAHKTAAFAALQQAQVCPDERCLACSTALGPGPCRCWVTDTMACRLPGLLLLCRTARDR